MANWMCGTCGNITLARDIHSYGNKCAICGSERNAEVARELVVDDAGYCRQLKAGRVSAKLFRVIAGGLAFFDKESKADIVVSLSEIGNLIG